VSLPELGVAPRPGLARVWRTGSPSDSSTSPGTPGCWPARPRHQLRGPAFAIAERLARQAPEAFAQAQPQAWPAAITWLLAEDDDIVGRGKFLSPTRLAAELGVGAPTLRARVRRIRDVLS